MKYKIKSGDTLSQIAKANGVSVSSIAKANNIENVNKIFAGKTITIPGAKKPSSVEKVKDAPKPKPKPKPKSKKKPKPKPKPKFIPEDELQEPPYPTEDKDDFYGGIFPLAVRQLADDTKYDFLRNILPKNIADTISNKVFGEEETITEKDLSSEEYDKLREIVKNNISNNKFSIDYDDYRSVGAGGTSTIKDNPFDLADNTARSLQYTFGNASIDVDDEGNVYLRDQFNFNDAKMASNPNRGYAGPDFDEEGYLKMQPGLENLPSNLFRKVRNYKTRVGRGEGEGAKSKIYLGKIGDFNRGDTKMAQNFALGDEVVKDMRAKSAVMPDDMKASISYSGSDEGGDYMVANGKKTYMPKDPFGLKDMRYRGRDELPNFPGIRPPRQPRNPQSTFDNDYSFLNLPGQGSAVRDPIDIAQDALPTDIIQSLNRTAPRNLPENDIFGDEPIVTPTRPQGILEDRNFRNTLESAIQNAESEIQQLRQVKVDLTNNYQQAVAQQDTIRAEDAEQQLLAIETREQELLSERQQIVTELEDKFGVEREGLQGNISELENNIVGLQSSIDALTLERDDAVANQDVIRATAADEQATALEGQKATLETEYGKTISDLQGQLDTLGAAPVVDETAPVSELPVVTEMTPSDYIKPENAYNPNYMGFEDERAIGMANEAIVAPPPPVVPDEASKGSFLKRAAAKIRAKAKARDGIDTPSPMQMPAPVATPTGNFLNTPIPLGFAGIPNYMQPNVESVQKINTPTTTAPTLNLNRFPQMDPRRLKAQMNQGGEVNRIQLLLKGLR